MRTLPWRRALSPREQVTDLDSAVSRLTVAQMAAKALNLRPSRNETPFGDVDDGYVTVLYEKIQLSGELEEDGTLSYHPEDSITRSELVAIIWRDEEHRCPRGADRL